MNETTGTQIELTENPMTAARTRRLATRCLICDTPLCDAKSVEIGVGPTCRKRTGLDAKTAPHREAVNALAAQAALLAEDGDVKAVLEIAEQVSTLGYPKVAEAIYKRFVDIRVSVHTDGRLLVKTPYSERWNNVMYTTRLGRWDRDLKARIVEPARKPELWEALRAVYPGRQGMAPDGRVFEITPIKQVA
jgi:hypothetical protein